MPRSRTRKRRRESLRSAQAVIQRRYRDPDLALADVALDVGISARQLQRVFREEGGEDFGSTCYGSAWSRRRGSSRARRTRSPFAPLLDAWATGRQAGCDRRSCASTATTLRRSSPWLPSISGPSSNRPDKPTRRGPEKSSCGTGMPGLGSGNTEVLSRGMERAGDGLAPHQRAGPVVLQPKGTRVNEGASGPGGQHCPACIGAAGMGKASPAQGTPSHPCSGPSKRRPTSRPRERSPCQASGRTTRSVAHSKLALSTFARSKSHGVSSVLIPLSAPGAGCVLKPVRRSRAS